MAKHKAKNTLTKIDPALLRPKPQAISQHATHRGVRVTTTVNPVRQTLPPLPEPDIFSADPSKFSEEDLDVVDDSDDENAPKAYYAGRVCGLSPLERAETHSSTRTIHSCYG